MKTFGVRKFWSRLAGCLRYVKSYPYGNRGISDVPSWDVGFFEASFAIRIRAAPLLLHLIHNIFSPHLIWHQSPGVNITLHPRTTSPSFPTSLANPLQLSEHAILLQPQTQEIQQGLGHSYYRR